MTEPLSTAEAATLFEPLRHASSLVLAVSGGPDSVALMRLAAALQARSGLPPLVIATVDHGLAAGSDAIARDVVTQAASLGLAAHVLRWDGDKPRTGLQDAARVARYALLEALASRIGATHLVTAHTLDDQAETVLFRLARGSGPAGLAGMRPMSRRGEVFLCRPLLGVPKARLVATCRAAAWPYVVDPANADPRFARARLRGLLPQLAAEGLGAATLALLGARLARDEAALHEASAACRSACLVEATERRQAFAGGPFMAAPAAVRLRLLEAALTDFAKPGPPRLARLEALAEDLGQAFAAARPLRRTLHGARITLAPNGRIDLAPEGPRHRGMGVRHMVGGALDA
ncbi:MAG TPA: tRNA lysidine(34) synthetase TilS [Lichenihabitans sp.]|jgi:tRNA(Ile)-lysidine synthase|nr:tRNA lysidine(34) synthetase TilS [Lichenihabitans sp.]